MINFVSENLLLSLKAFAHISGCLCWEPINCTRRVKFANELESFVSGAFTATFKKWPSRHLRKNSIYFSKDNAVKDGVLLGFVSF